MDLELLCDCCSDPMKFYKEAKKGHLYLHAVCRSYDDSGIRWTVNVSSLEELPEKLKEDEE